MQEPTYRQHKVLEKVQRNGDKIDKFNSDDDIEIYWELVRAGYLKNLVRLSGADWTFKLTEKADEYLAVID